MKLTDYQHLESLAAKKGAIRVDAADLLAWREEMAALKEKLAKLEREYAALELGAMAMAEKIREG